MIIVSPADRCRPGRVPISDSRLYLPVPFPLYGFNMVCPNRISCAQFVLRPSHDFWHGTHQSAGGALHGPAALCHRSRRSAGETHFVSALLLSPAAPEREREKGPFVARALSARPSAPVRVFLSQSALTQKPFLWLPPAPMIKHACRLPACLSGRAIVMFRRRLCPSNSFSTHSCVIKQKRWRLQKTNRL
jgi:hypothetical protein